jgi:LysM repeat protein
MIYITFLVVLLGLTPPLTAVEGQGVVDTQPPTEAPTGTPTPTFVFIPASGSPTATVTGTSGTPVSTVVIKPAGTSSVVEVKKAKIQEDGSIIHVVEKGQALWSIGMEYGVSVENLILFNNLPAEPVLQIGQKLIVQPPYTPTPTPTASDTPFPPTPTATRTLRPITPGPTLSPTATITPTSQPLFEGVDWLKGVDRRDMGISLIAICVLGLGGMIFYAIRKRREEKQAEIVDPIEAFLSEKQNLDR